MPFSFVFIEQTTVNEVSGYSDFRVSSVHFPFQKKNALNEILASASRELFAKQHYHPHPISPLHTCTKRESDIYWFCWGTEENSET